MLLLKFTLSGMILVITSDAVDFSLISLQVNRVKAPATRITVETGLVPGFVSCPHLFSAINLPLASATDIPTTKLMS